MPNYLCSIAVDWSWKDLTTTEKLAVAPHVERLRHVDSETLDTLEEVLAAASSAAKGRAFVAAAEDGEARFVLRARSGRVTVTEVGDGSSDDDELLYDRVFEQEQEGSADGAWFEPTTKLVLPKTMLTEIDASGGGRGTAIAGAVARASRRLSAIESKDEALAALSRHDGLPRMTIQVPIPTHARFDVAAHAARIGCTPSRVVQLAWTLAALAEEPELASTTSAMVPARPFADAKTRAGDPTAELHVAVEGVAVRAAEGDRLAWKWTADAPITGIAVTPDTVAVLDGEGRLVELDANGRVVRTKQHARAMGLAASRDALAIIALDGVHVVERSGREHTVPERDVVAAAWTDDGRYLALARGNGVALVQPGVLEQRWVDTKAPVHQLVGAGSELVGCTANGVLVRIDVANAALATNPTGADDGDATVLVAIDVEHGWLAARERTRRSEQDDADEDDVGPSVAILRWPSLEPVHYLTLHDRFAGDEGEPLDVTGLRFLASGRLAVALTSEQANVLTLDPPMASCVDQDDGAHREWILIFAGRPLVAST